MFLKRGVDTEIVVHLHKQIIETLVLLRRGNKRPAAGDTERKCGTKTDGKIIQTFFHLRIPLIYNYKTQTLF